MFQASPINKQTVVTLPLIAWYLSWRISCTTTKGGISQNHHVKCLVNDLGKPLTSFSANCAGRCLCLQPENSRDSRHRPTTKYSTKVQPRCRCILRLNAQRTWIFRIFSRVVRSIMTCSIGLRPLGHSDKICLTRSCSGAVAVLTTDECLKTDSRH